MKERYSKSIGKFRQDAKRTKKDPEISTEVSAENARETAAPFLLLIFKPRRERAESIVRYYNCRTTITQKQQQQSRQLLVCVSIFHLVLWREADLLRCHIAINVVSFQTRGAGH
jgi:hypothetical protein